MIWWIIGALVVGLVLGGLIVWVAFMWAVTDAMSKLF